MSEYRRITFSLPYAVPAGSEVMVEIWDEGPPDLLTRSTSSDVWNGPIPATSDRSLERIT